MGVRLPATPGNSVNQQQTTALQTPGFYGSLNPFSPSRGNSPYAVVAPEVMTQGANVAFEQFTTNGGLDENVARALNKLQANISGPVKNAVNTPMGKAVVFQNYPIANGATVIDHGMGQIPKGVNLDTFLVSPCQGLLYEATDTQIVVIAECNPGCLARVIIYA